MKQVLRLPFPPSLNNCFTQGVVRGRVRRFPSKRYKAWRREAQQELMIQRAQLVEGPVTVEIGLTQPDKRRRDVDNLVKPILDALVAARVLVDDSQVTKVTAAWADGEVGARVCVTPNMRKPQMRNASRA